MLTSLPALLEGIDSIHFPHDLLVNTSPLYPSDLTGVHFTLNSKPTSLMLTKYSLGSFFPLITAAASPSCSLLPSLILIHQNSLAPSEPVDHYNRYNHRKIKS